MSKRMAHKQANAIAGKLCRLLAPACRHNEGRPQICIAGSIRRQAATVGDIEIVAASKYTAQKTLLGDGDCDYTASEINRAVAHLVEDPAMPIEYDHRHQANGDRYKRLRITRRRHGAELWTVAVDLFIVLPPRSWGIIQALRTGPAEFSHLLVTRRRERGALPDNLRVAEGQLWNGDTIIPTPTEAAFFEAIGAPLWAPQHRSADRLRRQLETGS